MINNNFKILININWIVNRRKNFFELHSIYGEQIIIHKKTRLLFDLTDYLYKKRKSKISDVINKLSRKYSKKKVLNKIISSIDDKIFSIESNDTDGLSKIELKRYKWQLEFLALYQNSDLTKFDIQRNWKNSKVTIIGLGGEGSIIAQSLASMGIGNITGIDGDKIELSNLTRQIFYKTKDLGKYKAEVLRKNIKSQNPGVNFKAEIEYISSFKEMKRSFYDQDLVLLCADKPLIVLREWANKAATQTGVPYIAVSSNWVGPICIPFKTACFECEKFYYKKKYGKKYDALLSSLRNRVVPRSSFSFRPLISGTLIALQAAKFLSKAMPVEIKTGKYMLDTNFKFHFQRILRNKKCKICGN